MPGVAHSALNLKEVAACILLNPNGAEVLPQGQAPKPKSK